MSPAAAPLWEQTYRTSGADATRNFAERLARHLRRGDLLLLTGELGAGKTTFTQGLGKGLGVRPGIISPTFVLVRQHSNLADGPDLVHVDAYRLGSEAEVDDIDLEATLDTSVTVVEWGRGLVEHLAESRLDISLDRALGRAVSAGGGTSADFSEEDDDEDRTIRLAGYGPRWAQPPVLEG